MGSIARSLLFVVAAIGMSALQAQVAVGIRGGLNWAKMTDEVESLETPEARLGPAGAIFIDVPLTERLSLMPEIGFVQRGYKQEYEDYSPDLGYGLRDYHMVWDYADLAVLAKFHMGSGAARPHLLAGVTAGWMTGARQYNVGPKGGKSDGEVLDPDKVDLNRLNVGLCGGVGVTLKTGASHLFIEGRYLYGLTSVWDGLLVTDINGNKVGELYGYDRSVQITVGWMLPVGKRGNVKGAPVAPPTE